MFQYCVPLTLGIPEVFCLLNVMSVPDCILPVKVTYILCCLFFAMVPYVM